MMAFADRLACDAELVFMGSGTHEQEVTYRVRASAVSIVLNAQVDVDSFATGAAAENEFNPAIEAAAHFYIASSDLPDGASRGDTITHAGKEWRVQQPKLEAGMWTLFATAEHRRRRR